MVVTTHGEGFVLRDPPSVEVRTIVPVVLNETGTWRLIVFGMQGEALYLHCSPETAAELHRLLGAMNP